jgi:two-component system cell cycle response regulator DivK
MNLVLIIDDDWAIRESLTDILYLVQPHLRVLCAANGQKGIEMACAELPDLILLDGNMPDMNGVQVASQLRQLSATSKIPLIAMTGSDACGEAASALYRLCDAWLTKPFNIDCLMGLIRHISEPADAANHHTPIGRPKQFTNRPLTGRRPLSATIA